MAIYFNLAEMPRLMIFTTLAVLVLNLRGEVVADVADLADVVLHDQGNLRKII